MKKKKLPILNKDIEVIDERPYTPPTATMFFVIVMIILLFFLIFLDLIPFLVNHWDLLLSKESLKLYLTLLIFPILLGIKFYLDYRKQNKIKFKL